MNIQGQVTYSPQVLPIAALADVLALPSVDMPNRIKLPDAPGLYFVIVDRLDVVYVGISKVSLRGRWRSQHHRQAHAEDLGNASIAWMTCAVRGVLDDWERQAIAAFKPVLNRSRLPQSLSVGLTDKPVSVGAMARDLGVTTATVYAWVRQNGLPCVDVTKPGKARKRYLFNRRQVRAFLGNLGWCKGERYPIRYVTTGVAS